MRRLALLAALVLLPAATAHAAGPRWRACSDADGFDCTVLKVPLDRTGHRPGTVSLRVARQHRAPAGVGVLIALSGGPGQSTIGAAPFLTFPLAPALGHYRLVVLDQRGTGTSGALRCPALQRLDLLDIVSPQSAADCARRIGPRRDDYSTTDSVDDIDAVRQALGVDRIALQGTSYGTYVAEQYARRYPTHVERLILDSVVGAGGVDPLLLDTYSAVPRVLGEICAHGACRGITSNPEADLRTLAARLQRRQIRARVVGANGRARVERVGALGLVNILFGTDLNPHLQSAFPAAVRSALAGDGAPLIRLLRPAAGPPLAVGDLSAGLNVATTCDDTRLDYPLSSPIASRPPLMAQAVAAAPANRLGPFSRSLVETTSVDEQCALWPPGTPAPQSTGPFPDVPTLVLTGREDLRTPMENALGVAAQIPHAEVVEVPGTGHDELDSDSSGCVARALGRFIAGRPLGSACTRTSNQVPPAPVAPTSLSRVRTRPGARGARGRVLAAAVGAVDDARLMYEVLTDGGFAGRSGGGLRGGHWASVGTNGFDLHGASWVRGVEVTGRVTSSLGRYAGTVRVTAPHGLGGRLRFTHRGGVSGVLGGRRVHVAARYVRGAVQPSVLHAIG